MTAGSNAVDLTGYFLGRLTVRKNSWDKTMFCPGTAGVSAERKPSSGTQTFYLGTYDIIEDAVKARKCGEEMHEDILEWYY